VGVAYGKSTTVTDKTKHRVFSQRDALLASAVGLHVVATVRPSVSLSICHILGLCRNDCRDVHIKLSLLAWRFRCFRFLRKHRAAETPTARRPSSAVALNVYCIIYCLRTLVVELVQGRHRRERRPHTMTTIKRRSTQTCDTHFCVISTRCIVTLYIPALQLYNRH